MTTQEKEELDLLRKATKMMGFDPKKLADFVKDDDHCKRMLLGCVTLNSERLKKSGASQIERWEAFYSSLLTEQRISLELMWVNDVNN